MKGKFIVFEALDAAGKSTQVDQLAHHLSTDGIDIWKTKECTDGPIGQILRSDYLSGKQKCDEKVINILMAADRLEHVASQNGIIDRINKGQWVICDRFVLSAFAYDNYMHTDINDLNSGFDYTYNMNKVAMSKIVPDITIFLDLPVDECISRLTARGGKPEVFENKPKLELIAKTYERAKLYLKDQKKYDMNVININGNRGIDEISREIYNVIKQQFL